MKKMTMIALLASTAIGPMTAAERAKGRYMRAPDHGDAEFAAFEKAGGVEVGDTNKAPGDEPAAEKPAPRKPPRQPKPAAKPVVEGTKEGEPIPDLDEDEDEGEPGDGDAGEDDEDEDEDEDEGGEKDADGKPKPKQKASDRIRELNKRLRNAERERDSLKNGGLPAGNVSDIPKIEVGDEPDPADAAKYPLGHMDPTYVRDLTLWAAKSEAAQAANSVLQRQQEVAATARKAEIMSQVDDLQTKAKDIPGFKEKVIDTGLKGEWKLGEATFIAAHAADHGAQILYDLSQDTEEAAWLEKQSPKVQRQYVKDADAEITKTKTPRKIPAADAPPATTSRGASSRVAIKPDTDNLDDFEKAWKRDAAKGR